MIITFYVNDINKLKGIFPIFKTSNNIIYFFAWHSELSFVKNLLCNFGIGRIREVNNEVRKM